MCRHLGYLGPPARVGEILTRGEHSLRAQAWAPREMRGGGTINADGFGVAWWVPTVVPPTGADDPHAVGGAVAEPGQLPTDERPASSVRSAAEVRSPVGERSSPGGRFSGDERSSVDGRPVDDERSSVRGPAGGELPSVDGRSSEDERLPEAGWSSAGARSPNGGRPDGEVRVAGRVGRRAPIELVASRYRNPAPIWTDPAVDEVLPQLRSTAVLAAVRSATVGMPVERTACAPFTDGRWAFSHNGVIRDWRRVLTAVAAEFGADLLDAEAPTDSAALWVILRRLLEKSAPAEEPDDGVRRTSAPDPAESAPAVTSDANAAQAVTSGASSAPAAPSALAAVSGASGAAASPGAPNSPGQAGAAPAAERAGAMDGGAVDGVEEPGGAGETGAEATGGVGATDGCAPAASGDRAPGARTQISPADPVPGMRRLISAVLERAPKARLNLLLSDGETLWATTVYHSLSVLVTGETAVVASEPYDDDPRWQAVADGQVVVARPGHLSVVALESDESERARS